ncbi:D-lactate ferricytochrome c oxidoreductase [Datura stramonium]|uniref:D-lactate ferricytochrome c oxidoreductase n=1 Tax=Datura stramonium TaxID=4076 RepID=A0ABS8V3U0_DATST|nr:D-lactate ferricytochrome c oxidoreductase [Datura stramonium]
MAFSSLFSRLRSRSKPICTNLRTSVFHRPPILSSLLEPVNYSRKGQEKIPSWLASLIPLALAVSAGSLAMQSQSYPSLCLNDAPLSDPKSVKIGGKGSTDYAVKGSRREVPPELIEELKGICQDNMTMDEDERYVHGKPQNSFHKAVNIPDVVVYPRSEEEVSKIVKSCNMHKV